jgi:DnaJ-class molecular chaperone
MADAKARKRQDRIPFFESLLEEAKRARTALHVKHHPDRGGDPTQFKRATEAYEVIEKGTEEFKARFQEAEEKRAADRESKRSVFIDVDPLK